MVKELYDINVPEMYRELEERNASERDRYPSRIKMSGTSSSIADMGRYDMMQIVTDAAINLIREEVSGFKEKIMPEFCESNSKMAKQYFDMADKAEKMVRECYMMEGKVLVHFPIDINLIARCLGILVSERDLNSTESACFSKKLGIIRSDRGKKEIVVNSAIGYKTRRYAIAQGISRYLLKGSQNLSDISYAIPLVPRNLDETAVDTLAVFIMIPMTTFKDELFNYIKEHAEQKSFDVDAWLDYLYNKTQIPLFNLASGYQQMKIALCYQRQKEFEDCDFDLTRMKDNAYDIIYA